MPRVIDVIEFMDETGEEMVHRIPERGPGDFRIGSQVIVRESQAAVFFRDGKAYDVFGPGRHTITTANLPLLSGLLGLATRGRPIFQAEVYFVSTRQFLDQKWGTPEPITLRDSELGMVRLRAFGTYAMQIKDPQLFVNRIVGTQGFYETRQIEGFLRGIIVSKLTDLLGEIGKSILDLPALFEEIGAGLKAKVQDDFAAVGIDLRAVYVNSISPTEETAKAIEERAAMGAIGDMQRYMQFQAARAMRDAAQQPGGVAGAGVGLGAGVGMGAAMAQMMSQTMQQPTQQQQAQQQPQARSGGVTDIAKIQEVLDNLDMRLAAGEISEETYNRLYAKWEAKLKELGG
ncbi:MAG: SPFH domain-containing protein [Chloroflexi bacterium]|nr:MAG: SPFH domain-containing protein [Chloroflexota bacterium]